MDRKYVFPLCIQLTPPDDLFRDIAFKATLNQLREHGFYGVELNITDFDETNPIELTEYLSDFDLKLTMVATGVYANRNGLSLSTTNEDKRNITVEKMSKILEFAEKAKAGVICGYIKGGPNENVEKAIGQMRVSINELSRFESIKKVALYLEATNHYEATLVNTVSEGMKFAGQVDNCIKILPDTYHMNIEEANMTATIAKYINNYDNIHISDNNRYFPGFGAIDFFPILSLLKSLDYRGTISIEGRCMNGLHNDIDTSANYIYHVSEKILRLL